MKILILCTGNSCRSQMAEGFFRHYLNQMSPVTPPHLVRSAGIETHGLNPRAVKVMKETGIDISTHSSDNINKYINEIFDFVITVCDNAAQNCPTFPGNAIKIHWSFDDPAKAFGTEDEILSEFRRVRDEIQKKIKEWLQKESR